MTRNLSGHLVAWATCIALTLICAEIYGSVLFYRQHGGAVYFSRPETPKPPAKSEPVLDSRLHPYLGFTQRQAVQPFRPKPNDLIVAVFGGSVASRSVVAPEGGLPLEAALREQLPGKNVIVLNMAQGAAKQPQQVAALAMLRALGQHIDVVLNIDGFNEFAIGYENIVQNTHPIFPSMSILWQISSQLTPAAEKTADHFRIIYELMHAKTGTEQRTEAASRSRTGIEFLYNKLMISYHSHQRAAALAAQGAVIADAEKVAAMRSLLGLDMPLDPKEDPWEELFQIWLSSSDALKDLSRGMGARYIHIIQPNQYFSGRKFSAEEAKIALSMPAEAAFRIGAEHGYPLMERRAEARGIFSAIHLFDQQPEQIYADNCCHFTKAGETIFARYLAAQVAR